VVGLPWLAIVGPKDAIGADGAAVAVSGETLALAVSIVRRGRSLQATMPVTSATTMRARMRIMCRVGVVEGAATAVRACWRDLFGWCVII
jgi:hypothetical protein